MILALRALGLGDLLTAVPALRALRRAYPGERLVLAAPDSLAELVPLIGAVDELHPTGGLGGLDPTDEKPHRAVNLHGSGPESIRDLLSLGPEELWTHAHPDMPDLFGPPWRDDLHEVARWCEMLRTYGVHTDETDLGLELPAVENPAPGVIVVHPGAAHTARRWPPERFAHVIRELTADGHRVVITGAPSEKALAEAIAEDAGVHGEDVLAGRTSLTELAALIAGARLVICGDTGTGHLATAYRTPSLLLFGPTPPRLWGPPPHERDHVVLWAGCVGDPLAEEPDRGLLLLAEDRVLSTARDILERRP